MATWDRAHLAAALPDRPNLVGNDYEPGLYVPTVLDVVLMPLSRPVLRTRVPARGPAQRRVAIALRRAKQRGVDVVQPVLSSTPRRAPRPASARRLGYRGARRILGPSGASTPCRGRAPPLSKLLGEKPCRRRSEAGSAHLLSQARSTSVLRAIHSGVI